MDAVDEYNENWDDEYKLQRVKEDAEKDMDSVSLGLSKTDIEQKRVTEPSDSSQSVGSVQSKSKLFLSDVEKRQELKRKQRAELAAKKGQVVRY